MYSKLIPHPFSIPFTLMSTCTFTTHLHTDDAWRRCFVDELCALMQRLGVGFCTYIFKEKEVDGAELIHMSKGSFVSLLVEAGATEFTSANLFHCQLLSHWCHSGLCESQALKAWARLQSHLKLIKQAHTRMLDPSQHTSKKVLSHTLAPVSDTLRAITCDNYPRSHPHSTLQVRRFTTRTRSLTAIITVTTSDSLSPSFLQDQRLHVKLKPLSGASASVQ